MTKDKAYERLCKLSKKGKYGKFHLDIKDMANVIQEEMGVSKDEVVKFVYDNAKKEEKNK